MKPSNERAQRKIGDEFGQLLHEAVNRLLDAVEFGDASTLETWRLDLGAAFDAMSAAAYALDPLLDATGAPALRERLRRTLGPPPGKQP